MGVKERGREMPELPEVETIRRALKERLVGRTFTDVEIRLPRLLVDPRDPKRFRHVLIGKTVHDMLRRGKYLLFDLGDGYLLSHLRMEGKYDVIPAGSILPPHTHMIFVLDNDAWLIYRDVRQFGTMEWVRREALSTHPSLQKLGPEPLDDGFTLSVWNERLNLRKGQMIKAFLLDQTNIAGMGNIYVDEALYLAGIHPETPAGLLSKKKRAGLYAAIREVLTRGVEAGGASVRTYRAPNEALGYFQLELSVYGRSSHPCPKCGQMIERIVVAGRGTHFCPSCQKKPVRRLVSVKKGEQT